jgi:hypothetical protein
MMDGPSEMWFSDALEASAYMVCVSEMAGEDYAESIRAGPEGFHVILAKPIPMEMHYGILAGIAKDKINNPKKWDKTRREITERN